MGLPGRRAKLYALLATLAGSGLTLLASTQTWSTLHLGAAANHSAPVTVQGSAAAPALTALALAGLALAAALAIAGPLVRIVLGVLGVIIGASVLLSALTAVTDPVQAAAPAVTAATGVAGHASVAHLVSRLDTSIWPWFAVVGGALVVLCNLVVLVTSSRWPGPSKRYQAVRFEAAGQQHAEADAGDAAGEDAGDGTEPGAEPASGRDAAIDSWDELSRGEDPTR
jgi:uncharacterized membrane protein (TIGR02234 family)